MTQQERNLSNTASSKPSLLVTGASGHLGRRVVEFLLEGDVAKRAHIVAGTRSPDKLSDFAARGVEVRRLDFEDPSSLPGAFRGIARALIISTDALDRPNRRLEQHLAAIGAAEEAGVGHLVYTSLTKPEPGSLVSIANDHWQTEERLRRSGIGHTILRNDLYTDYLLGHLHHEVKAGVITNAYSAGAVGYVTREDCARAAAAALASAFDGKATYDISGPNVTQTELAAIVSEIAGRPVAYVPIDGDASRKRQVEAGLPEPIAALLVSFELAGAKGQLEVSSRAVEELTGKPPTSVRDFLLANRAAFV